MKYYKFKGTNKSNRYTYEYIKGMVYTEDFVGGKGLTDIKYLAKMIPEDWTEVKREPITNNSIRVLRKKE